ncbi:MAG: hypothetical protein QM528_07435 [Phycisphaerales bacterium]|nr:hypothetical protein [Phycisphaerales bacterium]
MNPTTTYTLRFNVGDSSVIQEQVSCNNPGDAIRAIKGRYGDKLRNCFIVNSQPYKK